MSAGDSKSQFGLAIVGNAGVGKSFLCNVVMGGSKFLSKSSVRSVTAECEIGQLNVGGHSVVVYNIPGLLESRKENIERNKRELDKAFQIEGPTYVLFVLSGGAGGRLNSADVTAFKAFQAAYQCSEDGVGFIVNQLPEKVSEDFRGEYTLELKEYLGWKNNPRIAFFHVLTGDAKKDDYSSQDQTNMRGQILGLIEALKPKPVHKVKDIVLDEENDAVKQMKALVEAQQKAFQEQMKIMNDNFKRQIEAADRTAKAAEERAVQLAKELAAARASGSGGGGGGGPIFLPCCIQ